MKIGECRGRGGWREIHENIGGEEAGDENWRMKGKWRLERKSGEYKGNGS
jgi:hypothetical protein